ncbi:hypothetical protein [Endozoicomonas lisbonensis]|uniref:Phage tail assembly protein n=1 Tax=Endozoicomonas lisbonensis TaxID=3120522 RepID=A0ABV2SFH1_9GAMM
MPVAIFDKPVLKTEDVEFRGATCTMAELSDRDFNEHLMFREKSDDELSRIDQMREHRQWNIRLIALCLKSSVAAEVDEIEQAVDELPQEAIAKLLEKAITLNGLDELPEGNSPTADSE